VIESMSGQHDKMLLQVLRGTTDVNISFEDLCGLLQHIGFDQRIRGSHPIFTKILSAIKR